VTGSSNSLFVDGNGNVGIGTTLPKAKLDVSGYIRTSGLVYSMTPCFSVTSSVQQSIPDQTNTLLQFNSIEFDTNDYYNTSAYSYTPKIAGYYQFNWIVATSGVSATTSEIIGLLYKNGGLYSVGSDCAYSQHHYNVSTGATLVYMNGTTDYVQMYIRVFFNGGSVCIFNHGLSQFPVHFSGFLVRPI
jgi:hypothetical protein